MASFNKVILMGNLTRDPQLKYLPTPDGRRASSAWRATASSRRRPARRGKK